MRVVRGNNDFHLACTLLLTHGRTISDSAVYCTLGKVVNSRQRVVKLVKQGPVKRAQLLLGLCKFVNQVPSFSSISTLLTSGWSSSGRTINLLVYHDRILKTITY